MSLSTKQTVNTMIHKKAKVVFIGLNPNTFLRVQKSMTWTQNKIE